MRHQLIAQRGHGRFSAFFDATADAPGRRRSQRLEGVELRGRGHTPRFEWLRHADCRVSPICGGGGGGGRALVRFGGGVPHSFTNFCLHALR